MKLDKRWMALGAGIVLSALLLVFALRDVDGTELKRVIGAARWWVIIPFLASLFAYYGVKTIRWAYLLRPVTAHATSRRMVAPVMIGYAAGALLPMQFGEIVRAWLGARQLNIRMLAALMSIALERVFDLLSILLLAALVFLTARSTSAWVASVIWMLAAGAIAALLLFIVFVFRTEQCVRLFERLLRDVSVTLRERLLDHLRAAAAGLGTLRHPRALFVVFSLSVLQWLFMFGCIWLSLYAMHLDLGAVAAVLTTVFTVIGISLPNSPGYVGSIQLAFTLSLESFGVPAAEAVAASLFFHLLAYVSVILCGLSMLPLVGMSVREVAKGTREATIESNQS